jgi:phosphatidylglycerol:prolipoprotein diacylglycerol transferase
VGIIFPFGGITKSDPDYNAIRDWAQTEGFDTAGAVLNLPRHPSQLYESFFEGLFLWFIIWILRNKKPFKGFLTGIYFCGYGIIRFVIEYFREPDSDIGYRFELAVNNLPMAISHPLTSFSTGQFFCGLEILTGILLLVFFSRFPDSKPVIFYPKAGEHHEMTQAELDMERERRALERKSARKLRKKLK